MSNKGSNNEQGTSGAGGDLHDGINGVGGDSGIGPLGNDSVMGDDNQASEGFLPWEAQDAGFGEDFQKAEVETKKATIRLAEAAAEGDAAIAQARLEPDLVKRARAMIQLGAINFPEEKPVNSGGMVVMQALLSDRNFYALYNAMFGEELPERPHFDTFSGMPVDHNGSPMDDRVPIVELVNAVGVAGLKGAKASEVRRTYRDWIMDKRMNDLTYQFENRVPEWDGVARLDTLLMDLFETFDTELNREFGRYFWLSIYCRIIYPGCFASMALSLFGVQGSGKSYLSTLICREVLGDSEADSVPLDLSANRNDFLRAITGSSIIANVGEMTGFGRGDLNKIKDFMTRSSDLMDFKYEKHTNQLRQWIVVMDGNKYEGLQRDDSGNRRFYPMFVGQLPDRMGQPDWRMDYSVDYTGFAAKFWQVMSECRAWLVANGGKKGYEKFAAGVSRKVQEFSAFEMQRDRGTIRDDFLDIHFIPAMKKVRKVVYAGKKKSGLWVKIADINAELDRRDKKSRIIPSHLRSKLTSIGGEYELIQNERGFLFRGFDSIDMFHKMLAGEFGSMKSDIDTSDMEIVDVFVVDQAETSNGGF